MPNRPSILLAVSTLSLALVAAACGTSAAAPAGSASPSTGDAASPAPTVAPSRDPDAIDHPTGATDVVVRVSEDGGFMMMEAVMSRLPLFTLYGDGTVLVVPDEATAKAGINGGFQQPAMRETHLSEDDVQALLKFALTDGRVGVAKEEFPVLVMDVPTTVIEVHAGGVDKTIKAAGLSIDPAPGPDAAVLRALASLVQRLRTIPTQADYAPPATMAILAETEPGAGQPVVAWPWSDLSPADFPAPVANDPLGAAKHLLTPAQLDAAGLEPGTTSGTLTLKAANGKTYVLVLRPAMPEEDPAG